MIQSEYKTIAHQNDNSLINQNITAAPLKEEQ
jgi:hypothetical protein